MRFFALLFLLWIIYPITAGDAPALKVPPGFRVSVWADHTLADDITWLATDERGRTIVAGPGYVRWLQDTNNDGRADKATDLVKGLKQMPMGLLWEGDTLWVMADGGLRKYQNVTGKEAVSQSELVLPLKTGGEHNAHAIRRGPDGWLYVLGGDGSGFGKQHATSPLSPVKDPTGGCLIRLSPDFKLCEIVGHGFRNPYSFDFDLEGKPFTYDSDNERCISLPWYEGCGFREIKPGGHHGWLAPQHAVTFRRPSYYLDTVAPIHDLGRGSPTGVVCYRHTKFPKAYSGKFFLGDWTHGRIWCVSADGSTKPEVFAQAVGDAGFAVSGLSVDETTGDLYASVGGRGTRGAVYRISCEGTGVAVAMKKHEKPVYAEKNTGPETWQPWQPRSNRENTLQGLRQFHLQHGDLGHASFKGHVFNGYTLKEKYTLDKSLEDAILGVFPTCDVIKDREYARLFAMAECDNPLVLNKVLAQITTTTHPVEDIHYLIVLARLNAPRSEEQTKAIASALLLLDEKMDKAKLETDRNWPQRITETINELVKKDPKLPGAILQSASFGRVKHLLFAQLPGFDKPLAARKFLDSAAKDTAIEWTPELVRFVSVLPETETAKLIPMWWERGGLEDAVLSIISKTPTVNHRAKYGAGLKSVSPNTVAACAKALAKLKSDFTDEELAALITALRKMPDTTEGKTTAQTVTDILNEKTNQTLKADAKAWEAWAAKAKPTVTTLLTASAGYNRELWAKRLAEVKWDAGDEARGKRVFAKATCAACHDGGRAVGPALTGVAQRFSKDDLMTAILDPARDVSTRYRPTRFTTTDGKTYEGMVIYDAKDAVLLLTGAETTVRVEGSRIETRKPSTGSLMPAGLLDNLKDEEIADLVAYLKSLKATK